VGFLFTVFVFEILGLKPGGGGKRRQEGRDRRAVQAGIGIIGVAIVALKCQSGFLVFVFDTSGVVSGAKGAAGVVALFLEEADFALRRERISTIWEKESRLASTFSARAAF
jgi:hypothetical protein